jgi:hypothetical protein
MSCLEKEDRNIDLYEMPPIIYKEINTIQTSKERSSRCTT